MAIQTTTFKGARYLVKFHDPIEWADTESYEAIEAVQHNAFTYISKQPVPAGVQIDNTDFWLLWADPNAQMEELRRIVSQYVDSVEQLSGTVSNLSTDIDTIEDTLPISNFSAQNTVKDYVDDKVKPIDAPMVFIDNFGADNTGTEYSDDAITAMIDYILQEDIKLAYISCIGGYYKFANTIDLHRLDQRVVSVDFRGSVLFSEAETGIITPDRSRFSDEEPYGRIVSQMFGNFVLIGDNEHTKYGIKCSRQCSYHDIIVHGFTDIVFYGTDTEMTFQNTIQGCNFSNIMCYSYNLGTVGFLNLTDCFLTSVYMWGFKFAFVTNISHFTACYVWGLYPKEERFAFIDVQAYLYETGQRLTKPSNINYSIIDNCEIGTINVYFAGTFENVANTKIIYSDDANSLRYVQTHGQEGIQSYIFKVYADNNVYYRAEYSGILFDIFADKHEYLSYSNENWGYYKFQYVNSEMESSSFFYDEWIHNDEVNKRIANYPYTLPVESNKVFKLIEMELAKGTSFKLLVNIASIDGPHTEMSFNVEGSASAQGVASLTVMPHIKMLRNPTNAQTCIGRGMFGLSYIYDDENEILTIYGLRYNDRPDILNVSTKKISYAMPKYNIRFEAIANTDATVRPTVIQNALCWPYDFTFTGSKTEYQLPLPE